MENFGDFFGGSITSSCDVNKDGICDLIVGAKYDDDGGDSSGCAFIFFGRQNWNSPLSSANANVKLIGGDADDRFGYVVDGH